MAIRPFNNETHTLWDKGKFRVMLKTPEASQPFGFCDGDDTDEQEIFAIAEAEDAEVVIDKKYLKTGREIWTIRSA